MQNVQSDIPQNPIGGKLRPGADVRALGCKPESMTPGRIDMHLKLNIVVAQLLGKNK